MSNSGKGILHTLQSSRFVNEQFSRDARIDTPLRIWSRQYDSIGCCKPFSCSALPKAGRSAEGGRVRPRYLPSTRKLLTPKTRDPVARLLLF